MNRNKNGLKALAGVCLLGLITLLCKPAMADDPRYPKATMFGLTYGYSQYQTKWTAVDISGLRIPLHRHFKHQVGLFMERRSMAQLGRSHLDLRGDVLFGVLGNTEQHYLPPTTPTTTGYSPDISDGGTNLGGNLELKIAFPLPISARNHFAVFAGGGVGFHLLQSNGEGVEQRMVDADLSYESGWTESLVQFPVSLGLHLDLESVSLMPQLRYTPFALAGTDWQYDGVTRKSEGATTITALIAVGFKSGR